MGNLLAYTQTFRWENTLLDRGNYINCLNEVIIEAKEFDVLFKTSSINNINLSWGNFLDFLFQHGYDDEVRKTTFPWMTQLQHQTLIQIVISFKNSVEVPDDCIDSFKQLFAGVDCELIGFKDSEIITNYISCSISYNNFHSEIVKNYNRINRNINKKYFNKFFKPELNPNANYIRSQISRKQCPIIIERLDSPRTDPQGNILHGEKFQIHFTNGACLNIDGTWKHGSFVIPSNVCDKLIEWGFVLPENL